MSLSPISENPFLIVISAPSGAGKTTVLDKVLEDFDNMQYSISSTTREPRGNEKHGIDYFFLNKEEFEAKIEENEFLEYANVFGNYYGTSDKFIQNRFDQGIFVIMDIDVQGCLQLAKTDCPMIKIFLLPPNSQELERRLRNRGTDSNEAVEKRLATARQEIELINHYDYLVVNDDLDEAVNAVKDIIKAEMHKINRYDDIYHSFYNNV